MAVPDYHKGAMSTQFHKYIRHLVECQDGNTRASLEEIEAQITSEIGEYDASILEDPITHQRRLEQQYVRGYLRGPGASMSDISHDQEECAQHQEETKPKQRRIKQR